MLVDAPMAMTALIPFNSACRVRIFRAVSPSPIISTTRFPDSLAKRRFSAETASAVQECGRARPRISARHPMELAVPSMAQVP